MPEEQLLVGRQPILDRRGQTYAYELLFRNRSQHAAGVEEDVLATSRVLHHVFAELGVERALGHYRGFLNCDARMLLMPGILDILPAHILVLEILESVQPTPAILARCRTLKAAGFMLALDDYAGDYDHYAELLPMVDVIKVDLAQVSRDGLARIVAQSSHLGARLLAEKVETREQADDCADLGFDLFQGYYFARPTVLSGRKLGLPQMALLRLLTLLMQDADTPLIDEVFKQQPGLSLNLLRLVNSASLALARPVNSLTQAIVVLGRRHLQRWVQLLLYSEPGQREITNPLLQLAATRGRLMESLAAILWPHEPELADQAFMVGMMSLMPALFSTPLADILASLPIAPAACDALLDREGALGDLLDRIEALEASPLDPDLLPPGIAGETYSACLTSAIGWANHIAKSSVGMS